METFTCGLIFIIINLMQSLLLNVIFAVFKAIAKKNKDNKGKMLHSFLAETNQIFTSLNILAVSAFKILPLIELFVAFVGEWFALFLNKDVILLFCAIYPILMGAVQKVMDKINSKFELDLDSVAELYSLLYASLPYKLVYLGLEELAIGFAVLGIKTVLKLIVYVLVP